MNTLLARAAAIAGLVVRLADGGRPGTRFGVLATPPGVGTRTTLNATAAALGLDVVEIRMSALDDADIDRTNPRAHHVAMLANAGDALVVVADCEAATQDALDRVVRMIDDGGVGRDGAPRTVVAVLAVAGRNPGPYRDLVATGTDRIVAEAVAVD